MPKKLENCVKSLMAQGKSKSSAFAICVKSTGLNPHSEEVKKAMNNIDNLKEKEIIDATEQFMEKAFENVEYKTITIVECKGAG